MLNTRTRSTAGQIDDIAHLGNAATVAPRSAGLMQSTNYKSAFGLTKLGRPRVQNLCVDFEFPERLPDVSYFTISLAINEELSTYQQPSAGHTQIFTSTVADHPVTIAYQVFSCLWDGTSRLLSEQTITVPAGLNLASGLSIYGDRYLQVGLQRVSQSARQRVWCGS
jgi:hypothetical protein